MSIKRMNMNNLPNDKHLGSAQQNWNIVKDYAPAGQPLFASRKEAFYNAILAEDAAYKPSPKDFVTVDMKGADDKRDDYMTAVRTILLGYTYLPEDNPLKRKGMEMYQVFKDFKFTTGDSYTGQSVKMDNMMQVFEQHQAKLESLGVWSLIQSAMEYNEQVKAYFATRIENLADRVVGQMRDARAALDSAYQALCEVIDAMLVLAPSEELSTIERRMNALVDYYKQYYIRNSSSSGSGGSSSQQGGSSSEQGGSSSEQGGSSSEQGGSSSEQGGEGTGEGGEQGGTTENGGDNNPPSGGGGFPGSDEVDQSQQNGGTSEGGGGEEGGSNIPPSGGGGFGG